MKDLLLFVGFVLFLKCFGYVPIFKKVLESYDSTLDNDHYLVFADCLFRTLSQCIIRPATLSKNGTDICVMYHALVTYVITSSPELHGNCIHLVESILPVQAHYC